ncbi:MAG: hypothetical protein ACYDC2_06955, partial [Solirubrobacteraceae bacterium]
DEQPPTEATAPAGESILASSPPPLDPGPPSAVGPEGESAQVGPDGEDREEAPTGAHAGEGTQEHHSGGTEDEEKGSEG